MSARLRHPLWLVLPLLLAGCETPRLQAGWYLADPGKESGREVVNDPAKDPTQRHQDPESARLGHCIPGAVAATGARRPEVLLGLLNVGRLAIDVQRIVVNPEFTPDRAPHLALEKSDHGQNLRQTFRSRPGQFHVLSLEEDRPTDAACLIPVLVGVQYVLPPSGHPKWLWVTPSGRLPNALPLEWEPPANASKRSP